jgi:16S rRNA (uracil1498-N3)-methyltransferase
MRSNQNSHAPRFFAEGRLMPGSTVRLTGADARKIVAVLRMRDGDEIELCDSGAHRFRGRIELHGRAVHALVEEEYTFALPIPDLRITVAQALPKGSKMDFVVEKLTELGVAAILPLRTERAIADASAARIERWRRLARSAAQQCGRAEVPVISEPLSFAQLIERPVEYDRFLLPWELADRQPLRDVLPELLRDARTALVAIGPEGGFSHDEAESARAAGAVLVSLGRRILRTETAALALVAMMNFVVEA